MKSIVGKSDFPFTPCTEVWNLEVESRGYIAASRGNYCLEVKERVIVRQGLVPNIIK